MRKNYETYLEKGTRDILKYFASVDVTEDEREAIANVFAEELSNHIGDTDGLSEYEPLIYAASLQFIDSKISQIQLKSDLSYSDYEDGIILCMRQQNLLKLFGDKGWLLPKTENSNPEECKKI